MNDDNDNRPMAPALSDEKLIEQTGSWTVDEKTVLNVTDFYARKVRLFSKDASKKAFFENKLTAFCLLI